MRKKLWNPIVSLLPKRLYGCTSSRPAATKAELTAFFGDADSYNQVRPSVHPEILQTLETLLKAPILPSTDAPTPIVELGSGTGIFTSLLLSILPTTTTHRLICLEPVDSMRALHAQQLLPQTNVELLPNPCADLKHWPRESVSAIVSAQALHWMTPDPANVAAIRHVLQPNGLLWMAWNTRMVRTEEFYQQHSNHIRSSRSAMEFYTKVEEWVDQAYERHPSRVPRQTTFQWNEALREEGWFTDFQSHSVLYHRQGYTLAEFHRLLSSISVIQDAKEEAYSSEALNEFLTVTYSECFGPNTDTRLDIPYLCESHWCRRKA